MTDLRNADVQELLAKPNFAVVSTHNGDGSIASVVTWVDVDSDEGTVLVNTAVGRRWQKNLESQPALTLAVVDAENPYHFVEIHGEAQGTTEGADEHIDGLAKKYLGQDTYPFRAPGEQRIKYVITPTRVRHVKQ